MGELRPLIEGLLKRFFWADRALSPDSGQWGQALQLSSLAGSSGFLPGFMLRRGQ
jgi:hypothetical protein